MIKKFILDFLVRPLSRVIKTKQFPITITDKRIHKNVSCSYWKYNHPTIDEGYDHRTANLVKISSSVTFFRAVGAVILTIWKQILRNRLIIEYFPVVIRFWLFNFFYFLGLIDLIDHCSVFPFSLDTIGVDIIIFPSSNYYSRHKRKHQMNPDNSQSPSGTLVQTNIW